MIGKRLLTLAERLENNSRQGVHACHAASKHTRMCACMASCVHACQAVCMHVLMCTCMPDCVHACHVCHVVQGHQAVHMHVRLCQCTPGYVNVHQDV